MIFTVGKVVRDVREDVQHTYEMSNYNSDTARVLRMPENDDTGTGTEDIWSVYGRDDPGSPPFTIPLI